MEVQSGSMNDRVTSELRSAVSPRLQQVERDGLRCGDQRLREGLTVEQALSLMLEVCRSRLEQDAVS